MLPSVNFQLTALEIFSCGAILLLWFCFSHAKESLESTLRPDTSERDLSLTPHTPVTAETLSRFVEPERSTGSSGYESSPVITDTVQDDNSSSASSLTGKFNLLYWFVWVWQVFSWWYLIGLTARVGMFKVTEITEFLAKKDLQWFCYFCLVCQKF